MLIHTELFSNVSVLSLIHCGLGLVKIFGPRPRPHSFWPRPYAQLASLTSLERTPSAVSTSTSLSQNRLFLRLSLLLPVDSLFTSFLSSVPISLPAYNLKSTYFPRKSQPQTCCKESGPLPSDFTKRFLPIKAVADFRSLFINASRILCMAGFV